MECVGFSIEEDDWLAGDPEAPANIVTRKWLSSLPVGEWIEQVRRDEAAAAEIVGGLYHEEGEYETAHAQWRAGQRFKVKGKAGGRPPRLGDDHYRKVARIYTNARRGSEAPLQAIRNHPDFARGKTRAPLPQSTAARWVRECRKREILSPAPEPGVAGGVLLPRQSDPKEGT